MSDQVSTQRRLDLPDLELLPYLQPPGDLSLATLPNAAQLMLKEAHYSNYADRSLFGNLNLFGLDDPSEVPDAIGLTIRSAVPMADVIRGMFAALGRETPLLFGVPCNRDTPRLWAHHPETRVNAYSALKQVLERQDIQSVLVIDQFVSTGDTLKLATQMVKNCGPRTAIVKALGGQWYEGLSDQIHIDPEHMTSDLAPQMHAIGVRCVEKAFGDPTEKGMS